MRYKPPCFGILLVLLWVLLLCCPTATAAVLLLSTVLCACKVVIFLVVVITRDFESQLKSAGHAKHSQPFLPELPWIQARPAAAAERLDYRMLCLPCSRV